MRKLFDSKNVKTTYDVLQKKRKSIKRKSILLAFFVLGVNIYAWFIFIAKANLSVSSNVVSWDVNFSDENSQIKDILIETEKLYPGMPTYTKNITITNSSDVKATFSYEVDKITVLGEDVIPSGYTPEQVFSFLRTTYPFDIKFSASKTQLEKNDRVDFSIMIDWPYESKSSTNQFYRLTSQYQFDPSVVYYHLNSGAYVPQEGLTEEEFLVNKTGLYLEKDDADSFWGSTCNKYLTESTKPCVNFHILLTVTQRN